MDKRQKAIEEIKKKMQEQRARLNPDVLAYAQKAAARPQKQATVPYDKDAAQKAVELFLRDHKNAKGFTAKLSSFMKEEDQQG